MKIRIVLETLDGDPYFEALPEEPEIWEKICLCLDGELPYIVLRGEDNYERIIPRAILEEVVVRKGLVTEAEDT